MASRAIVLAALSLASCHDGSEGFAAPVECVADSDCSLIPSVLTCCEDCPPIPPFEARPTWVVDAMYIENDERCAGNPDPCPDTRCPSPPPGCSGHAVCDRGRCRAVASGCERRS